MAYICLMFVILLTALSHLIFKWRVSNVELFSFSVKEKIYHYLLFLLDPWIIFSYVCVILTGILWMITLSRMSLSYAYPFLGLNFLLVPLFSWLLFNEGISGYQVIGFLLMALSFLFIGMRP